ncbi:hypothetical protein BCR35DRAFT_144935 [Leucosporidium creatinivorum]|uniref:F-box domain-containing protein n=1 Tax=Leucosporidium creatinivorum TaxID=106004 RepID=A0A1Y2ER77_9BASI|nr:hypothetical protein BCR35DRAFT_144935 [Leucosporidium creatinivorum]
MDSPSTRQRSSSLPARLPSSTSTKRNPALLLSEEALDLICTHITRFSSKSAIPTLSSFSLTTQHWLNPGQRALFRQPLRALRLAGPGACRVAQSLAEAIRNPILAGYVRSLEELADTASSLDAVLGRRKGRKPLLHNSKVRSIYKDDYQIGSSSDEEEEEEDKKALTTPEGRSAFAWSVHLLRSCHRVTRASFPMGTEYQARTMAKLIKTSLPKLQRIRLISTDDFTLDGEVLNEFFESVPPMREFQRLTMEGLEWDESFDDLFGGGGDGERLGLRIKELVLLEADLPWAADAFLRFLPHQTTLTTLYISTYPYPDSIDLTTLLESLGDQLETFILKPEEDLEHYTLSSYGDTHDGYSLPITLFSSIPPALTHLTLQYGQDMTPESLLALAHSSPQLRHLDLEGTIWWTSDPDHYCGCPHWEETVCLAIEHFEQIESIHLGSLPLTVEMKRRRAMGKGMIRRSRCRGGGRGRGEVGVTRAMRATRG